MVTFLLLSGFLPSSQPYATRRRRRRPQATFFTVNRYWQYHAFSRLPYLLLFTVTLITVSSPPEGEMLLFHFLPSTTFLFCSLFRFLLLAEEVQGGWPLTAAFSTAD